MLDEKPEINTDGINIAIYTDGSGNMMQQTAWKAVLIVADCAEAVQAGAVGTTANCAVGTTVFPTRNSFFTGLLRFGAKHGKISVVLDNE